MNPLHFVTGVLIATAALSTLTAQQMSTEEQTALQQALGEAGNSPLDFVRALEAHLARYPQSAQKLDLERALVKTSTDLRDNKRVAFYGELILQHEPDNVDILERVATAQVHLGDPENLRKALKNAEHLRALVEHQTSWKSATGREAARHKDDTDHALARAYLLEARTNGLLGSTDKAIDLAKKSYGVLASVEAGRECAKWLAVAGKNEEAVQYLADAFSIANLHAADADQIADRQRMAELYRKYKGSDAGLGDVVLQGFDRTSAELMERRAELRKLDPNSQIKDPTQFTLSALAGEPLKMSSLLGKVVILDFWATWCGPCREQHPLYEQVKEKYKGRTDVVFLSIDTDEDHSIVKPFLDSVHWTQTVYFEDGLSSLLQVTSIPTTLIINKEGQMVSRMTGFIPERFVAMLADRIDGALGASSLKLQKQ